jgi:hypothetical protein
MGIITVSWVHSIVQGAVDTSVLLLELFGRILAIIDSNFMKILLQTYEYIRQSDNSAPVLHF